MFGVAPLGIYFTNMSSGEVDSLLWDFGDGEFSEEINLPPILMKKRDFMMLF
ncbi:MAG: hypothetical protein RAO94_01785 [Candidatus Stygibacter australis]|nr:hypothetical protein [Candidatus Stygibacter australis]